jgi:transcriptional regulator, MarR family
MDNNCIHKVHNIFRAVVEFERALETKFEMNINELMLLCMLANNESLLAGEIANEMGLSRSNASKVIAALERKGYLERHACKNDSRCQRCSITKEGLEQMEHINCDSFPPPPNLAAYIEE